MCEEVFESEACRVWTGALGTPLHVVEDAEQSDFDVIPFSLQIWIKSAAINASVASQSSPKQGLYLAKDFKPGVNKQNQSILLPSSALSCFSIYSPSPFVSSVLVVLDVDDDSQQGYFFGRVRRVALRPVASGKVRSEDQDKDTFYDTEVAEELLAALHTAFPKVQLSSSAKNCIAKREMSRCATGLKLGEMVKRRKTLSAEAFYGSVKSTVTGNPRASDNMWHSFYEKLQFRVSHSLLCQLEGTAPISSSFPRQQEAFEFADQVTAFRQRVRATRDVSSGKGSDDEYTPRVFSFESAGDGKRRFLVASLTEFWNNYKKTRDDHRHVYEIIREGVPCRLYFDLEFKREINLHVDGNELVARLVSLLQLQLFRRYGIHVQHRDIYHLDSSTSAKFSRHLIFHFPDGSLFTNNLHAGAFVRECISDLVDLNDCTSDKLETPDDLLSPFLLNTESGDDPVDKKQLFIDTGVYTRNRMFRVLGSSKFKKQVVLRSMNASSDTELDFDLFMNTLVCPYPSLEALELTTKDYRLLHCEASSTLGRNQKVNVSGTKSTSTPVECRRSVYPMLDAFIRSQATTGGVQGEIRAIQMLMTSNSAMLAVLPGQEDAQEQAEDKAAKPYPWMIIYHMARNRWCANIRRPHKSNNVMFIVDIDQRVFYQKCHDPTCQAMDFRSPPQPLPPNINLSTETTDIRDDHCGETP
ncbi:Herpesviridae UL52/UL70 DNA primase [Phytophthora infestans]|uniref:DNA-directed primase/polymerase protein n=1 Tax=Phytophthora infestans TaxID=4787 RepID=A0A833T9S2_PHYIN|nr:Herpesviridae UL52/UL70 DNA primase [Phytophthora infestans]